MSSSSSPTPRGQDSHVLYDSNDIPGSPVFMESPYNSLPVTVPSQSSPSRQTHSQHQSKPSTSVRRSPRTGSFPEKPTLKSRPSILDEIIPVPITHHASSTSILLSGSGGSAVNSMSHSLRRSGSLAIICIFLLSIVFVAVTEGGLVGRSTGLRDVFRIGSLAGQGGVAAEGIDVLDSASGSSSNMSSIKKPDFDQYSKLQVIPASHIQLDALGHRLIFIGDVHGSLDPLKRLMDKLNYNSRQDRLIHVGDLVAKGTKNDEVLTWMRKNRIQGVRGNHDQPVVQWRAWMEWAGGLDWEASLDSIAAGAEDGAIAELERQGKMFPKEWDWKGEHWKIARTISKENYQYLLQLPLTLHLPSLHTFVVHAGLLPSNPLLPFTDSSQPLESSALSSPQTASEQDKLRTKTELSILSIPQNMNPWNLLNMRSIYVSSKSKHKVGEISKSGKKGKGLTPWSQVWGREMKRCTGSGSWLTDGMGESGVEEEGVEEIGMDAGVEVEEEEEVDEVDSRWGRDRMDRGPGRSARQRSIFTRNGKPGGDKGGLACSPITVIYGHAAGRGLDIKQFSKGIDTGCVYGRQLTALVMGDLSNIKGEDVRVDAYHGKLVHVSCGSGGT